MYSATQELFFPTFLRGKTRALPRIRIYLHILSRRVGKEERKNAPVSPYKMPPFLYSAGQKVFLSRLVTIRGGAALQMMMDLSRTFSTNAKKKF